MDLSMGFMDEYIVIVAAATPPAFQEAYQEDGGDWFQEGGTQVYEEGE